MYLPGKMMLCKQKGFLNKYGTACGAELMTSNDSVYSFNERKTEDIRDIEFQTLRYANFFQLIF